MFIDGNDLAKGLIKAVSTGEELLDDDMLAFRFGGRKTMINHFKRPKTVETKGAAGTGTSKNSNDAAPRSDPEGNGCLNSDNQKSTGRILLSYEDEDVSGYVTYDADYDAPMHHPPKNN